MIQRPPDCHTDWISEEACEPTWASRTEEDQGTGVPRNGSEASLDFGSRVAKPQFRTPRHEKDAWALLGPSWKASSFGERFQGASQPPSLIQGTEAFHFNLQSLVAAARNEPLFSFPLQTVSWDGEGVCGEVTRELLSDTISGLLGGWEDIRVAAMARNQTVHLRKWLCGSRTRWLRFQPLCGTAHSHAVGKMKCYQAHPGSRGPADR